MLNINSSSKEMIDAMKDSSKGLSFLNNQYGLPSFSFISADATFWVMERVQGVTSEDDAIHIMEVSI